SADRAPQDIRMQAGQSQVDRIAVEVGVGARLKGGEPRCSLRVGRGRLETGDTETVGDDRSSAARRREDRHAFAAELPSGGQDRRNIKQLLERLRPDNAD